MKKTKLILIVSGVVLALFLILLIVWIPELVQPVVFTLLFVALLWLAADVTMRVLKKKKQRSFDEGVAAKEGIDDRKREWEGWLTELEKHGVDRYELPFYLLVGEPQSGKSVMLQNSDLHFPFGQDRLSGIGGTRGCDWWFTEEAVILDIAGRLFTHEGGVADKLEWEAFLKLLSDFRPLNPANGVILVVPCDSLLSDTDEQNKEKANKIQNAFLTLSGRLQAQLPVYLVLTKGDKVFGFAESVHRLDAKKRHEMFGWSRSADKSEEPFDIAEVGVAFDGIVERARALRSQMMVSARLPEALPEIDRLYAFPEELKGVWPSLETYLRRIFSETSLVDRMTFRGVYLTSGLQTGVPIARVCGALLGEGRQSDQRELDTLFTHQRAYFIKDLVRRRVFSERGLVRPTEGRVLRARKNALIGFGASAAIALIAVLSSIFYLFQGREEDETLLYDVAIRSAAHVAESPPADLDLPEILQALHDVKAAEEFEQRAEMENVFLSTRERFAELYTDIFDRRLVPALRDEALAVLRNRLKGEPKSHGEFLVWHDTLERLIRTIDFGDPDDAGVICDVFPSQMRVAAGGGPGALKLAEAIAKRGELDGESLSPVPEGAARELAELGKRMLELWDGVLTPGKPWAPGEALGYILAWKGAVDAAEKLRDPASIRQGEIFGVCERFAGSLERIERIQESGELERGEGGSFLLENAKVRGNLAGLGQRRAALVKFVEPNNADEAWPKLNGVLTFSDQKFQNYAARGSSRELLGGLGLGGGLINLAKREGLELLADANAVRDDVPGSTKLPALLADGLLRRACAEAPLRGWSPRTVVAELARGNQTFLDPKDPSKEGTPGGVFRAKAKQIGWDIQQRYAGWRAIATELGRTPDDGALRLDPEIVGFLAGTRRALKVQGVASHGPAIAAAEKLLREHLEDVERSWDTGEGAASDGTIVWELVANLNSATGNDGMPRAEGVLLRYMRDREGDLLTRWRTEGERGSESALVVLSEVADYLANAGRVFEVETGYLTTADHRDWREALDSDVALMLEDRERELYEHWSPETSEFDLLDLETAAKRVLEKVDERGYRDKINDAPEFATKLRVTVPDSSPLIRDLERARVIIDRIRRMKTPAGSSAASNGTLAKWLQSFARGYVGKRGLENDGKGQADLLVRAVRGQDLPAAALEKSRDAGEYYAARVYEAFYQRLVRGLRERYLARFSELVLVNQKDAMAALFARSTADIEDIDEEVVMRQLGKLCDRGGILDDLRDEFSVETLALRPAPGAAYVENADHWAFDAFLHELQVFLRGDEDEVSRGEVQITLTPDRLTSDAAIWGDPAYPYFYFPADSLGGYEYRQVSSRMGEHTLPWNFDANDRKRFRLRWSATIDEENEYPDDAKLELHGSLAPLCFAWSGKKKPADKQWIVDLNPEGSKRKAYFIVEFDRDLPEPPPSKPDRLQ